MLVGNVKTAIGAKLYVARIVEGGREGVAAVAAKPGNAVAGHRFD